MVERHDDHEGNPKGRLGRHPWRCAVGVAGRRVPAGDYPTRTLSFRASAHDTSRHTNGSERGRSRSVGAHRSASGRGVLPSRMLVNPRDPGLRATEFPGRRPSEVLTIVPALEELAVTLEESANGKKPAWPADIKSLRLDLEQAVLNAGPALKTLTSPTLDVLRKTDVARLDDVLAAAFDCTRVARVPQLLVDFGCRGREESCSE